MFALALGLVSGYLKKSVSRLMSDEADVDKASVQKRLCGISPLGICRYSERGKAGKRGKCTLWLRSAVDLMCCVCRLTHACMHMYAAYSLY